MPSREVVWLLREGMEPLPYTPYTPRNGKGGRGRPPLRIPSALGAMFSLCDHRIRNKKAPTRVSVLLRKRIKNTSLWN